MGVPNDNELQPIPPGGQQAHCWNLFFFSSVTGSGQLERSRSHSRDMAQMFIFSRQSHSGEVPPLTNEGFSGLKMAILAICHFRVHLNQNTSKDLLLISKKKSRNVKLFDHTSMPYKLMIVHDGHVCAGPLSVFGCFHNSIPAAASGARQCKKSGIVSHNSLVKK